MSTFHCKCLQKHRHLYLPLSITNDSVTFTDNDNENLLVGPNIVLFIALSPQTETFRYRFSLLLYPFLEEKILLNLI